MLPSSYQKIVVPEKAGVQKRHRIWIAAYAAIVHAAAGCKIRPYTP